MMDNSEIARIATNDMAGDALELLNVHYKNDDVIFFLGRLVWQGQMASCAPVLSKIAVDPVRGVYARIAAIRGAMAVGDAGLKDNIWRTIVQESSPISHSIFAELIQWAESTVSGVELILQGLQRIAPYDRFHVSGLEHALHSYIDTLPLMSDDVENHPLGRLVDGLNDLLISEPHVERGICHVSEKYAWLMPPALHAINRLVGARSSQALKPASISIMQNVSLLSQWRTVDLEHSEAIATNVPRWVELNDRLYWSSIESVRLHNRNKGEPVLDDWSISVYGHLWGFDPEDFERCLGWVASKRGDDRSVALSLCIRLYIQADRPVIWLSQLQAAIADDKHLMENLDKQINPKPSLAVAEMNADHLRWKREFDDHQEKQNSEREGWVRQLRENPDRALSPQSLERGSLSRDQCHLIQELMNKGSQTSHDGCANWQALIPEFGETVARNYRDAAIAHWREYWPGLRSEGANTGSTPYSLMFAMAGLLIEATEDDDFVNRLAADEARRAFRYVGWELNGFPAWFEQLFRAFPHIGYEAVEKELVWELAQDDSDLPIHYIVDDILYYAPWLHAEVAPVILNWLRSNESRSDGKLQSCLSILAGGSISAADLSTLARAKLGDSALIDHWPRWYSLWVDVDAVNAIPVLEELLGRLEPSEATHFAQRFIVALVGDRRGVGARIGSYRNADGLKSLYVLMHRHIRAANDIDRANKGVFSPTLRDNAQDARNQLFELLSQVPGRAAYVAIKSLEADHPEPKYRKWMAKRARDRAIADGDEPTWTVEQVRALI